MFSNYARKIRMRRLYERWQREQFVRMRGYSCSPTFKITPRDPRGCGRFFCRGPPSLSFPRLSFSQDRSIGTILLLPPDDRPEIGMIGTMFFRLREARHGSGFCDPDEK